MTPLRPQYNVVRRPTPGMVAVPIQWKPKQGLQYPSDNTQPFERWFMDGFTSGMARERLYLPIQWTAIYCNNRFGADKQVIANLQTFLNTLDRSKKYYTIIQYDDGILNDVSHLDLQIFSMGGGRIDYPIPLLCMPHRQQGSPKRDIFASFIGRHTHPIREKVFAIKDPAYYISDKGVKLPDYVNMLQRSLFTLAPRGYGINSFRLQEAAMSGSIPVYISDTHCIPYNLPFDYGVVLGPDDDIVASLANVNVGECQRALAKARHLFTYEGCRDMIIKNVKE